jgi:hypothetical protein
MQRARDDGMKPPRFLSVIFVQSSDSVIFLDLLTEVWLRNFRSDILGESVFFSESDCLCSATTLL